MRQLLLLSIFAVACGSSSSDGEGKPASCPNLGGKWTVSAHCDASLIGMAANVSADSCSLAFAAPFNGFTGTVSEDGEVTVSGPQTCTGTATTDTIALSCTPGTCAVTLSR